MLRPAHVDYFRVSPRYKHVDNMIYWFPVLYTSVRASMRYYMIQVYP